MKTRTRRQLYADETYGEVERLIWRLIHNFVQQYGFRHGTKEELFSEAGAAFVKAYDSYDPSRGAFTTHIQWKVTTHLMRLRTDAARRHAKGRTPVGLPDGLEAPRSFLREFLADLSDDARHVVRLALDTPAGLRKVFEAESADGPFGLRLTLRSYLDGRGWSRSRINKTFREVREALG